MNQLNLEEVARKYNEMDVVWNEKDTWHVLTKNRIHDFVLRCLKIIPNVHTLKILNAGSAGNSYGLAEENILHVDIAKDKISHLPNSMVIDVQDLSGLPGTFDMVMCVGSVINYCDPVKVISEFTKVLNKGGYLILEFENSHTLELIGKPSFNKEAVLLKSFYNGKPEELWFFSESYIRELLTRSGFTVISVKRFHILSPLIYRFYPNENFAAHFAKLDRLLSYVPFLNKFSSNTLLLCSKGS